MADKNDLDRVVGANILRYRSARGLSQADLAAALTSEIGEHVHQQTIQKLEKGTRPLRYSEAVALAQVLHVELDDLQLGAEQAKVAASGLAIMEEISQLAQELHDFANRLAPKLVSLAFLKGREAGNEIPETAYLNNWGRDLNNHLLDALRRDPYLADIKPELRAPTYNEVLKRVAESPIILSDDDASDT